MKQWVIAGSAVVLCIGGVYLAYPTEAQHLAGLILIIAGLHAVTYLLRNRA